VTVTGSKRAGVVELGVVDQGVGIPEEEMERIFRKFYRGRIASSQGGTGLGLFITRGLVTAMGGRIWADSTEGGAPASSSRYRRQTRQRTGNELRRAWV